MANEEVQIIETVDENGKVIKFQLFDIINFEEKEYALLLPEGEKIEESEVVLMKLVQDGEDYIFEAIETDEEFEKVANFIENLEVEDE